MPLPENHSYPVVCFGEVLWDLLPTGAVPGGAPVNVAYHLQKQNMKPAVITKTGIDAEGKKLVDIFSGYGVCTDYFQSDSIHATGKVYAKPNEHNEVVYDIVKPVAWDFIEMQEGLEQLTAASRFFVFGSLAARNKVSRNTLFSLLDTAPNKVLDINLRAPHFNKQLVKELLHRADFVKMNLAELELITGWFSNYTHTSDRMKSMMDTFSVPGMVVTMGGDGAMLNINGESFFHEGFIVDVVDTVGSGDAFLAGLLTNMLNNASPMEALDFASRMGAFIATQKGACPPYDTAQLHQSINVFAH